jgi:hypothetical protein
MLPEEKVNAGRAFQTAMEKEAAEEAGRRERMARVGPRVIVLRVYVNGQELL